MLVVEAEYEGKSLKKEFPLALRSGQLGTRRNKKSVQEVSKHFNRSAGLPGHYGKTDIRHWLGAVFRQKYTRNGLGHHVSEWAIKIQHVGRRETFPLGTANRTAAAAKAKDIYLSLQADGWEATLTKFKPKANESSRPATTVGEFLEQLIALAGGRSKTIESYCRAFRTIVAGIFKIDGGSAKFDYRLGGGREKWIAKIHAVAPTNLREQRLHRAQRCGEVAIGGIPLPKCRMIRHNSTVTPLLSDAPQASKRTSIRVDRRVAHPPTAAGPGQNRWPVARYGSQKKRDQASDSSLFDHNATSPRRPT
jgi:hypothetical protein